MRVAFTSSTGITVDEHFGSAERFFVWEIGPETADFVGQIAAKRIEADEDDRITARASALAGCAIVYTMQVGGPAAAKLIARRIMPMKTHDEVRIADAVRALQKTLRERPPPWLRKIMTAEAAEHAEAGAIGRAEAGTIDRGEAEASEQDRRRRGEASTTGLPPEPSPSSRGLATHE